MADPVAFIDSLFASLPPLLRIAFWAALSGGLSMWAYARLSPQKKLVATKEEQKSIRQTLMRYDGPWQGMRALISKDLSLSLKQIRLIFLPFAITVIPVVLLMVYLASLYTGQYLAFGPDWIRGFEFSYIVVLLVVSLAIKITFKIA